MEGREMVELAVVIRSALAEEKLSTQDRLEVLAMVVAMVAAENCGSDEACLRAQLDKVAAVLGRVELIGPDENGYWALGLSPRGGLQ